MLGENKKMNNNSSADKYLRTKIFLAKITGIAVLIVSMQFSQSGFGFKGQDIAVSGWVLAIAVTVAQFVFNSRVRNLNWTITVLGIMAYVYSIWTNIVGFYAFQGKVVTVDMLLTFDAILPVFASAFMDIFPETIISYAFNASGEGDLIGNVMAVAKDPDSIFSKNQNSSNNNSQQNRNQYQNQYQNQTSQNNGNHNQSQQRTPQTTSVMSNLPRTNVPANNVSSQTMGYKTEAPQKQPMDDELRSELMKGIEEMRNKNK